ncbi:MAG: hypothetical protein Q8903_04695 [Bacteroidota bacterium]|nr:hypothetical protein [Bacteroidota bacterium]
MNNYNMYNWSINAGDYHSAAGEYEELSIINKKKSLLEKIFISLTILGSLTAISLIVFTH